jgi:hypothetical protein
MKPGLENLTTAATEYYLELRKEQFRVTGIEGVYFILNK